VSSISAEFAAEVSGVFDRYLRGDLTLVTDVVQRNNDNNDTNTSVEIRSNPHSGDCIALFKTVSNQVLKKDSWTKLELCVQFDKLNNAIEQQKETHVLVVKQKDDKIDQLMIEMKEQSAKIDNLLKHAEKSEVVAAEASADLRVVRRTVVQMSGGHVKADNIPVLKRHCFMILKAPRRRNNKYKIIMAQNGYAGTVSNKIIAKYSNVKVIVRMKCPNPNEFWASIKSACLGVMGRGKKIVQVANKSWIKFEGFTDADIKSCVKKVDTIWRKNLPYPEPESFSDSDSNSE
jgi:predicted regulator of Ras-like GTPase activity (Roadblock/LC7/MglB family)